MSSHTDVKRRFLTGLLGYPISHSAAPTMHEHAAETLGARCFFHLLEIPGADRDELRAILDGVRRIGFSGLSVTFPYKETVISLLDDLSPGARAIGAVNAVVIRDGKLTGHNTDTIGFERAVKPLVEGSKRAPVALIGTGGVGKAIIFALSNLGVSEIRIFDTDKDKAERVLAQFKDRVKIRIAASIEEAVSGAAGLVNGTPIGMLPNRDTPVPDSLLRSDLWVSDAVYFPLWTPLLNAAKAKGAQVMTGRDLNIYQAVAAFELFTGLTPSTTEMGIAFDSVMVKRYEAAKAE